MRSCSEIRVKIVPAHWDSDLVKSIDFTLQVKTRNQFLTIRLKKAKHADIYFLRPGEEIYLVHHWFPDLAPTYIQLPVEASTYDVLLKFQVIDGDMDKHAAHFCSEDSK